MPARLVLEFLGLPQVHLDKKPVAADRRKAIALIVYLAVNDVKHSPQKYSRESLSALLWPDYDQTRAFSNLRRTIWEIHQVLGEGWLIAERESVCLNGDAKIDLDIARFLDLISQGCQQTAAALRIPLLADAVRLYRNHFLTGFSLKDAYPFNEWAFAESEELRHQLADALSLLSTDYGSLGKAEKAIPHARRLIALEPLNESAHRQLMEIYIQAGQHSAALKQYQVCEQILRKELNLDPQPETRELYKKIRKREIKPARVEKELEIFTPQHNLPFQLSSFIGREKEQEEIATLLKKNRLVTLAGVGGIGKTRLALQVGQKLLNGYPDGIWFIPLDSLSNPTLVPQTVASIFDIRETAAHSTVDILKNMLRPKSLLLILDNCEHLLDSCAQLIRTLLQSCPQLSILTTSRELLKMEGEAAHYLDPLSIPEDRASLEKLTEYESIQLFTERAALALSTFSLTKEDAQAIVEICRKVDGIPLAIELAAARVNILQVEEILKQLQHSFAVLVSDNKASLPRQQTLQASMDWSWGLLNEAEQIFLKQLSVFEGGWTLESARVVCDVDPLGVVALINALAKKSLIAVEKESGHETRYRFHEIVRAYALEKFIQSGSQESVRTRHLTYFLNLSEQAELELRGPARVEWMDRLNQERHNIRAALHWADRTDPEAGLYLSARLMRYWESADLREGAHWLELFLHKPASKEVPLARAAALHTYGWLLTWLQQFNPARTVTEESLKLFQAAGDRRGQADALICLGNIVQFTDAVDSGTEFLHQALALARGLGDTWREALAHQFLGWGCRDPQQGFIHWEKAIQLYRKVGDQISLANLLAFLSQFRILNGDIEAGEKHLNEAIHLWQANKRANAWESPKVIKSLILLTRGEYEQAYTLLQEALASAEEKGNRMSYIWLRVRLGYAALHAGHLEEARALLVESAQNFYEDNYATGAVFALEGMAALYIAVGKPERAARLIGLADAVRTKIHDDRPNLEQADVDKIIAACLAKMGEIEFSDAYDEGQKMTLDEAVSPDLWES